MICGKPSNWKPYCDDCKRGNELLVDLLCGISDAVHSSEKIPTGVASSKRILADDYKNADMYSVLCWDDVAQEAYWESPKDNPVIAAAAILGERVVSDFVRTLGGDIT